PLPPLAPHYRPLQPLLATTKARYVGECVALVVADTPSQAKEAGECLVVNYEPLAAVTLGDALADNAPKIWDDAPSNLSFVIEGGDAEAVDRAFAAAAHVTALLVHYPRAAGNPLEPRAATAWPDLPSGRMTLFVTAQAPFLVRQIISHILKL